MPYDIFFMTSVLPALIYTAGGVGAVAIVSRVWLRNKKNAPSEELDRIVEALEVLQHSVDDLRDDMRGQISHIREISGRVEFTERLLTGKQQDQVGPAD